MYITDMSASWWEIALDIVFLGEALIFTIVSLSHIAAMWALRKNFFMAVRSPLLANTSGLFAAIHSCVVIFDSIQGWTKIEEPGIITVYGVPMILTLFVGSYVMRGIRLLVIYEPKLRRRWGCYFREMNIFIGLIAPTLVFQMVAWAMVPIFGLDRVARVIDSYLVPLEIITILSAAALLARKLGRTEDLFNVSTEILVVGGIALVSLVLYVPIVVVPMSDIVLKYLFGLWGAFSLQSPVFITNIVPVRRMLHESADGYHECVNLFPYAPWTRLPNIRLAAAAGDPVRRNNRTPSQGSHSSTNDLANVMAFLPLREAFQDFCQKALCSESVQFLSAVADFKEMVHALIADEETEFEQFLSITQEFIQDLSPGEVNIGEEVKSEILIYARHDAYIELSVEEREMILVPAEKEIEKMLAENLLTRFKNSPQYKHIAEELLSVNP